MAKTISLLSASPFVDTPIVYNVTASDVTGTVSFHNVMLQVSAGLQGGSYVDYVLHSPVDSGETVQIDISSALRAVASTYQYEATAPVNYPYISFTLKAWDEYMQNGAVHEKVGVVTDTGGRALLGGYSDLDRLLSSASRDALYFTRKPTSHPELLCDGDTYILPNDMSATIANITAGPRSLPYPVVIDKDHPAGLRTLGGRSVYVMPAQRDRYQFRFINRFGVMESFAAMALRETTVAITKSNYLLANRETFNSFSRRLIKKQNDVETWKLSTGPLDDDWQQWVMHDFLMTEHAWILVSGNWLPCVVSSDDSVSALNRHAHDVMDVQFSVIFDLNGSPSLKV